MTRTERSEFPRALDRDRHENKTGVNSDLRKGGAGPHNWGSLEDELMLEEQARMDEEKEMREEEIETGKCSKGISNSIS
jgi:hypothetical protein